MNKKTLEILILAGIVLGGAQVFAQPSDADTAPASKTQYGKVIS